MRMKSSRFVNIKVLIENMKAKALLNEMRRRRTISSIRSFNRENVNVFLLNGNPSHVQADFT